MFSSLFLRKGADRPTGAFVAKGPGYEPALVCTWRLFSRRSSLAQAAQRSIDGPAGAEKGSLRRRRCAGPSSQAPTDLRFLEDCPEAPCFKRVFRLQQVSRFPTILRAVCGIKLDLNCVVTSTNTVCCPGWMAHYSRDRWIEDTAKKHPLSCKCACTPYVAD